jgi:nitrite reductase/ring-hydroxylating ferredoxin subunit
MQKLNEPGPQPVLVCALEALPPGSRKLLRTDLEVILVLNIDGVIHAISNICPHSGGYMQYGPLEGHVLECPLHYWPFDVRTGELVGMNQDSLLDEGLEIYPVQIQDDQIYVII